MPDHPTTAAATLAVATAAAAVAIAPTPTSSHARLGDGRPHAAAQRFLVGFTAALMPLYVHSYGPLNFLYACDVALFLGTLGLAAHSPLAVSTALVGIALPQALWVLDFIASAAKLALAAGGAVGVHEPSGGPLVRGPLGVADYMFDPALPAYLRLMSSFHAWLPALLLAEVWKMGYDARALHAYAALASAAALASVLVSPAPPAKDSATPTNINFVYGWRADLPPQTLVPMPVWVAGVVLASVVLLAWPAHALLCAVAPRWDPALCVRDAGVLRDKSA